MRRLVLILVAMTLGGCSAPARREPPRKPDRTLEAWYVEGSKELTAIALEAENLYRKRKRDAASEVILKGQSLMQKLLSVPGPTWEVTVAASELDDLYGRMLLDNKHYGWARLAFQKNVARWKNAAPQSDETMRRLKLAQQRLAEVDRLLETDK